MTRIDIQSNFWRLGVLVTAALSLVLLVGVDIGLSGQLGHLIEFAGIALGALLVVILFRNPSMGWLYLALTLPFFEARFTVARFNISPAMVVAALTLVAYALSAKNIGATQPNLSKNQLRTFLVLFFYLWNAFSSVHSTEPEEAIRVLIKLTFALGAYLLASRGMTSGKQFSWFLKVLLATASVYMAYLAYVYLVQFGASFIGVNTELKTGDSKNSLGLWNAVLTPLVVAWGAARSSEISRKERALVFVIAMPLLLVTTMALSRGTWVAVLAGLLVIFITAPRKRDILLLGLSIVAVFVFLQPTSVIQRAGTVLIDDADGSTELRLDLAELGIDLWATTPIIGLGLGGFLEYSLRATHNDYIRMLAELGIVGLASFVLLFGYHIFDLWRYMRSIQHPPWYLVGLLAALVSMFVRLFFINAYDHILLWLLLGFAAGASSWREEKV